MTKWHFKRKRLHYSSVCMKHTYAEIEEGKLALGPKLTRPAICEIKGECKALRYLEVFSMLWSTVHLFLVLLFRKNDIRRSPDMILPQTLQIVLSALPHDSQPQIAYDLLNTSFRNITVLIII